MKLKDLVKIISDDMDIDVVQNNLTKYVGANGVEVNMPKSAKRKQYI